MNTNPNNKSSDIRKSSMDYTLIRSNRKSICIEIGTDLQITVRAPRRMPDSQIRAFVDSKDKWINDHIAIMKDRISQNNTPKALDNDNISKLTEQAKAIIPERVQHFAGLIGVSYGRITIRHQKTRWGSCSSAGNLNFNCMLMTTTPELIDYVVVHELCHRKQMNHSPLFWAEVEKILPDYRELRSELKKYRC